MAHEDLSVASDSVCRLIGATLAHTPLMTDLQARAELLSLRQHALKTLARLSGVEQGELPDPHTRQFL